MTPAGLAGHVGRNSLAHPLVARGVGMPSLPYQRLERVWK